jgi:hypothetical protein
MIRPRQALLAAGAVLLATRPALSQTAATSAPAAADSNYALVWFLLSTLRGAHQLDEAAAAPTL